MNLLGHFNYWIVVFLMMVGFYTIIARGNLVKKIVGLSIFQTSVFIFYISLAKIIGGTAPILIGEAHGEEAGAGHEATGAESAAEVGGAPGQAAEEITEAAGQAVQFGTSTTVDGVIYSNPLPHVLILTAIVVAIATTALALALVVRIKESYGTIEEDEIQEMDLTLEAGQ